MLTRRANGQLRPVVSISNTDVRIMDALQERVGCGRVYTHVRAPKEGHKRTGYTWRMTTEDMRKWLPHLLPWLVIKRHQAELMLVALELKSRLQTRRGEPGLTYDLRDNYRAQLAYIATELRAANRKGVMPEP